MLQEKKPCLHLQPPVFIPLLDTARAKVNFSRFRGPKKNLALCSVQANGKIIKAARAKRSNRGKEGAAGGRFFLRNRLKAAVTAKFAQGRAAGAARNIMGRSGKFSMVSQGTDQVLPLFAVNKPYTSNDKGDNKKIQVYQTFR